MALQLGEDEAPNYTAETTDGEVNGHEWLRLVPQPT